MNLHQICIKLEHSFLCGNYSDDSEAYAEEEMSAAQIKVWHKCFKYGQESVESDPCSGRSATSKTPENVDCVWAAINKDG